MFFANEKRDELRKQYPDKKITEIGKELGKLWKELTDDEKKPYADKAAEDKKRYTTAMESYTPPEESSSSSDEGPKKKKRKKAKKDPNAPKRSLSSFMIFSNEKRAAVREANPTLSVTETSKKLSEMWKGLLPDERAKYIELAEKDKQRYKHELEGYTKHASPSGSESESSESESD